MSVAQALSLRSDTFIQSTDFTAVGETRAHIVVKSLQAACQLFAALGRGLTGVSARRRTLV